DGLSGIFRSHLDLQGRLGGKLDIHLLNRLSLSASVETYNTVIAAKESPMNGWRDEFYSDASLSRVQERRVYLAEDVQHRLDELIPLVIRNGKPDRQYMANLKDLCILLLLTSSSYPSLKNNNMKNFCFVLCICAVASLFSSC